MAKYAVTSKFIFKIKTLRSRIANQMAYGLSRSYYITQMARKIVRAYDNDSNGDIKTNGELLLLKLIVSLRNKGTLFDVGANRGDWSAEALGLNFKGRLFAVDPLPTNINNLKKRFKTADSFTPIEYALSDSIKEAEFFSNVDESQSGTDSLYNMNEIGYAPRLNVVKVKCTTLDSLARELNVRKIDFLKIDVEGHELFVLRGAKSLLSEGSIDFIQIEFGHAARAARLYLHDIVRFINEYSYNIYVIKPDGFMPLSFTPFTENRYSYINFLLVRKSVAHEIDKYTLNR